MVKLQHFFDVLSRIGQGSSKILVINSQELDRCNAAIKILGQNFDRRSPHSLNARDTLVNSSSTHVNYVATLGPVYFLVRDRV